MFCDIIECAYPLANRLVWITNGYTTDLDVPPVAVSPANAIFRIVDRPSGNRRLPDSIGCFPIFR